MTTDELSMLGNCCTGRLDSARMPTITSARLTTIARTGCLMKTSVKERMVGAPRSAEADGLRAGAARRIGHRHEHRLAQLERPRGRDALAGREAVEHDHLVADDVAHLHAAQLRARLSLLVLGEHEHVIAARILA